MQVKTLSHSSLQLYSDCPFCFKLKTEGHKQATSGAMNFGSRLHKAIEKYHKEGQFEFEEDLQDYLAEYMSQYDREYQTCEEFWRIPLLDTDITFISKVDLIKSDVLTDHKTSQRAFTQEYVDSMRQLTAYSWSWSQQFSEKEKSIRINLFNTNPKSNEPLLQILETTRNEDDFKEWEEWTREILAGIEADYFEVGNGRFHNFSSCPKFNVKGGENE